MGSPWWYRKRALVFGVIYVAGFWGVALYDDMIKQPYVSAAHQLHADAAFVVMLIRWEERGMRERYGQRFADYCARVPQLFPRLARGTQSMGEPSVREGFRAEIVTATILAGAIAIIISPSHGWLTFMVLYVLGMSAQTLLARNAAAA